VSTDEPVESRRRSCNQGFFEIRLILVLLIQREEVVDRGSTGYQNHLQGDILVLLELASKIKTLPHNFMRKVKKPNT
jgi:hypothetical protein